MFGGDHLQAYGHLGRRSLLGIPRTSAGRRTATAQCGEAVLTCRLLSLADIDGQPRTALKESGRRAMRSQAFAVCRGLSGGQLSAPWSWFSGPHVALDVRDGGETIGDHRGRRWIGSACSLERERMALARNEAIRRRNEVHTGVARWHLPLRVR